MAIRGSPRRFAKRADGESGRIRRQQSMTETIDQEELDSTRYGGERPAVARHLFPILGDRDHANLEIRMPDERIFGGDASQHRGSAVGDRVDLEVGRLATDRSHAGAQASGRRVAVLQRRGWVRHPGPAIDRDQLHRPNSGRRSHSVDEDLASGRRVL